MVEVAGEDPGLQIQANLPGQASTGGRGGRKESRLGAAHTWELS